MGSKVITASLPESVIWKLDQANKRTNIPKSTLIQMGLLLLFAELVAFKSEFMAFTQDITLEDVEAEYQKTLDKKELTK